MIPLDKTLLSRLLQVRHPWEVRDFRIDDHTRTCEVLIGMQPERRGWFGRARPNPWGATAKYRWTSSSSASSSCSAASDRSSR